LIEDILLSF